MGKYIFVILFSVALMGVFATPTENIQLEPVVIDLAPSNSAKIEENLSRQNFIVGHLDCDRLLHRVNVVRNATGNAVQNVDFIVSGAATTIITHISAIEQGPTQNATARIWAGGLYQRSVTIRFTSAAGRGFNYLLDVSGRY